MDNQRLEDHKRKLMDMIVDAFECNAYPGDDNIAAKETYLESEFLNDFIWIDWQNITIDFLVPLHKGSLSFMTPTAYAYFVPAYMIASIEHYDESDLIPDNLVWGFTLPVSEDIDQLNTFIAANAGGEEATHFNVDEETEWFYERVQEFSDNQKKVICRYLLHLMENHAEDYSDNEPQIAIDRYWKKFM